MMRKKMVTFVRISLSINKRNKRNHKSCGKSKLKTN